MNMMTQTNKLVIAIDSMVGGVAQWYNAGLWVGKPSAGGQPSRSTQPFILYGSINE